MPPPPPQKPSSKPQGHPHSHFRTTPASLALTARARVSRTNLTSTPCNGGHNPNDLTTTTPTTTARQLRNPSQLHARRLHCFCTTLIHLCTALLIPHRPCTIPLQLLLHNSCARHTACVISTFMSVLTLPPTLRADPDCVISDPAPLIVRALLGSKVNVDPLAKVHAELESSAMDVMSLAKVTAPVHCAVMTKVQRRKADSGGHLKLSGQTGSSRLTAVIATGLVHFGSTPCHFVQPRRSCGRVARCSTVTQCVHLETPTGTL